MPTAVHCCGNSALPSQSTLSRMLKNFRVVVMMVFVSDPNLRMEKKMNSYVAKRIPQFEEIRPARTDFISGWKRVQPVRKMNMWVKSPHFLCKTAFSHNLFPVHLVAVACPN